MKWEYLTVSSKDEPYPVLEVLGKRGWELVTVISEKGDMHFFFKRPLVDAPFPNKPNA